MRAMTDFWTIAARILGALGGVVVAAWLLTAWWKKSDDRPGLLKRWLLTLADLLFLGLVVGPIVGRFDYGAAFVGVPMAAVGGLILAIIWVPHLAGSVGRKFGQLYDGGDVPPDPEPFFSIAEARQKTGRYIEAVAELEKQLEVFPTHFRGLMMLAEIQADNLHDLPAATETIERIASQPVHAPKNVAYAFTRLADWQLKYLKDPVAARATFQRIVDLFPDSPEAYHAHQRLAHLATAEFLAGTTERKPLKLTRHEDRLGLRPDFEGLKAPAPDPVARAEVLVRQLERFPLDSQAREELALVYACDFGRLDLAAEQLEQLVAQPCAPEAQVTRWLNLLAELQAREGGDVALARQTLERIIERSPESGAAEAARRRMATIGLELRAKKESRAVALGSYEKRLGLKMGGPPPRHTSPPST
ncbi:MAG TPA: tetratricopeptide repeat protein [Verrucomicrobiota bacterium]|nr:tetratricopeptide repeat protein [Verrucomicrobiota bacterium]HRZ34795.1 tetratricopeptide repeat protein [Candidatus Paceibacterota bacterium]